jgi:hydroxyacylglutathione hydrolase
MVEKIAANVWKIKVDSNVYIVKLEDYIVVDTGPPRFKEQVEKEMKEVVDPAKVKKVILTHLHYDHAGNISLFPNAEVYASEDAIKDLKKSKEGTVLGGADIDVELKPAKDFNGLKILKTPGHTRGSICVYYPAKRMLFSGDTYFGKGCCGRTDLPTSEPDELVKSLKKIKDLEYDVLCPGHDYVQL